MLICIQPLLESPKTCVPSPQHLFSGGGEIATDQRSRLGADKFEHLQVLKHAWHFSISDHAATNSVTVESVDILEQFKELLVHDGEMEHKLNASELVVTN